MFGRLSQDALDVLDFVRCERPDGTAYGTAGICRKGVEREKTVVLGEKASRLISEYASELKKVWPQYSTSDLKEAVAAVVAQTEVEKRRIEAGEITHEEIEHYAKEALMPDLSQGRKFLVIGMEPGKASDNEVSNLAVDLATLKVGERLGGLGIADAASFIVRAAGDNPDQFAKNVVGLDPQPIRGHSYAKQLTQAFKTDLRPEQFYISIARANVRPFSAVSTKDKGVYGVINEQKDPRLKNFGRKESGAFAQERVSKILNLLTERGRQPDFQGGLFAPGGDANAKQLVKTFVDGYRKSGGQVVEYTTKIGSKGDTPLKTYTLKLPNGSPFVVLESSITKMSIAGRIFREAYNDVVTNFVKETSK